MARRSLSIALCTYNGGAHLREQLSSIGRQTCLPDELVVFDDCSSDDTVSILEEFAVGSKTFPVRIHVNSQTFGPTQNFAAAIAACNGDVIALCDQDDVWREDKLALTQAAFQQQPDVGFIFGNAIVCDEAGNSLGYSLWNSVRFSRRLQRMVRQGRAFEVLVRQNVVTGATLAFASRFRSIVLPIDSSWMHDGWTALLLSAVAPVGMIDQPIIRYRQHARQAVGALQRTLYEEYKNARAMDRDVFQKQAAMFQAVLARLKETGAPAAAIKLIEEKIRHCERRSSIRQGQASRLLALGEFLSLRYRHFSLGWKSFAQDLFL